MGGNRRITNLQLLMLLSNKLAHSSIKNKVENNERTPDSRFDTDRVAVTAWTNDASSSVRANRDRCQAYCCCDPISTTRTTWVAVGVIWTSTLAAAARPAVCDSIAT